MNFPQFCLNERAFAQINALGTPLSEALADIVTLLEDALSFTERPFLMPVELFSVSVDSAGTDFSTFLFSNPNLQDRNLIKRLERVISRGKTLDALENDAPPVTVVQGTSSQTVDSKALRHIFGAANVRDYYGLLSRGEDALKPGVARLFDHTNEVETFVVCAGGDLCKTVRRAITELNPQESTFFSFADKAFPQLIFCPELSFRRFSTNYAGTLEAVCEHLGFLNDEFLKLAAECRWNLPEIAARAPVRLSDESPNTKANKSAMRQRNVVLRGIVISCTLHTKIRPTVDRIHFHPPVAAIDPTRVIIGIFVDHLET